MDRAPADIDPMSGPPGIITPNSSMLETGSTPSRVIPPSDSPGLRQHPSGGIATPTNSSGSGTSLGVGQGPAPVSMTSGSTPSTQLVSNTLAGGLSQVGPQSGAIPSVNGVGVEQATALAQPNLSRDHTAQVPQLGSTSTTQSQQSSLPHQQSRPATQTTTSISQQQQTSTSQTGGNTSLRDGRAKQQSARRCAINFLKIYYRTLSANSKDLLRYYDLNACVDRIGFGEFQNDEVTGIGLQSVRNLLRNFGSVNRVTIKLIDYQYSSEDNVLISVHGSMQFAEPINPSNISGVKGMQGSNLDGSQIAQTVSPNTDIDFLQIFYLTKNSKGWWVIQNDVFRIMAGLSVHQIPMPQTYVPVGQSMDSMMPPMSGHGTMGDPRRINGASSPLQNSMGFSPNMNPVGSTQGMTRSQDMMAPSMVPPMTRNMQPNVQNMLEPSFASDGSSAGSGQYRRPNQIIPTMSNDGLFGMGSSQSRATNTTPHMGVGNAEGRNPPRRVPRVSHSQTSTPQSGTRSNPNVGPVMTGLNSNGMQNTAPTTRSQRRAPGGGVGAFSYPNPSSTQHDRAHSRPVSSHGSGGYSRNVQYDGVNEYRRPRSGPQFFGPTNRGGGKHYRSYPETGIFLKTNNMTLSEDEIREACSQFGEVENVEIVTGKSFSFVYFKSAKGMMKAVDKAKVDINGQECGIQKKKPHNPRNYESGGYSGNRRGNRSVRGGSYESRPSSKSRSHSDKSYSRDMRDGRHNEKRDNKSDGDQRSRKQTKSSRSSGSTSASAHGSSSPAHGLSPKKSKKKKNQNARGKHSEDQPSSETSESGHKENVNPEHAKNLSQDGSQPKLLGVCVEENEER